MAETIPDSLRPARHYPRFRIWRPSSGRQRDFNPPEQRAAQHTLCPLLTSALRSGCLSAGRDRASGPERPVQVSRTIVQRVLREGVAILTNDRAEDEAFGAAKSLIASRIESVLCVPLVVFKKVLGAIYLDTKDPQAQFEEDHLQLMMAIATSAALSLKNVLQMEWLENENRRLQADIDIQHDMVGGCSRLREVHQFIAKVAPTDSSVLITGESGTGKELVARAIHRNSKRANKPFVAINCAALIDTLLESELFGHEKGAFTGAVSQKKGKLEVANCGTVFLDEMGELAPGLQAKLLRFLQEHEFERVGGTRPIKVDIRLVAATNRSIWNCFWTLPPRLPMPWRQPMPEASSIGTSSRLISSLPNGARPKSWISA